MPELISRLKSSRSNEWYTPAIYVDAARELMGGIDLDPASCAEANRTVRAERYYSVDDDGLAEARPWRGRVWLNPPYGRGGAATWSGRLVREYLARNVEQACLLVGANTDTRWFQRLVEFPVCLVEGRIRFDGPNKGKANTNGSAIFYLPPPKQWRSACRRFAWVFRSVGPVFRLVKPERPACLQARIPFR